METHSRDGQRRVRIRYVRAGHLRPGALQSAHIDYSSAVDEISGEPVAIKLVTKVTQKIQLAKRALRELTLLRHFSHENITGLIDVDISPNLDEV